jgi:hypothetical protein
MLSYGLKSHLRLDPKMLMMVSFIDQFNHRYNWRSFKFKKLLFIGPKMSEALPQEYIDRCNKIAGQQIIIASIRLALVIENIFGSPSATEKLSFLQ